MAGVVEACPWTWLRLTCHTNRASTCSKTRPRPSPLCRQGHAPQRAHSLLLCQQPRPPHDSGTGVTGRRHRMHCHSNPPSRPHPRAAVDSRAHAPIQFHAQRREVFPLPRDDQRGISPHHVHPPSTEIRSTMGAFPQRRCGQTGHAAASPAIRHSGLQGTAAPGLPLDAHRSVRRPVHRRNRATTSASKPSVACSTATQHRCSRNWSPTWKRRRKRRPTKWRPSTET